MAFQVHFYHTASWSNVICQCKFYNIILIFSMLIHAIWNLLKKMGGMQVFHTFCISTGKRSMMTSNFISRFSDKKFFLSMRNVLNKKPLFIFMAILLNCTDWAITNQIMSLNKWSILWGIKWNESESIKEGRVQAVWKH